MEKVVATMKKYKQEVLIVGWMDRQIEIRQIDKCTYIELTQFLATTGNCLRSRLTWASLYEAKRVNQ